MFCDKEEASGGDGRDKRGSIFSMSPQLLNTNKRARNFELPFAPTLKRVLANVGSVVDSFESEEVSAEHMLLPLLGYDAQMGGCPRR